MSFSVLPVFLAFVLNRCSIRFVTVCRCTLGFTPFSASVIFGLSLVSILVKHPELYPVWMRRVNTQIMFLYEFFASLIFIEIGFCLWNSLETFLFYKVPLFIEENCLSVGEFYIHLVESPVGISVMSNSLALALLLITLHTTKVCNFSLLLQKNGVHKFFADAGLTSTICRHHKDALGSDGEEKSDSEYSFPPPTCAPVNMTRAPSSPTAGVCSPGGRVLTTANLSSQAPRLLRSGKRIY